MGIIPIPNRVILNMPSGNHATILRGISRIVAAAMGWYQVGVHDTLTTRIQDVMGTRLLPGLLMLDGCLTGIDSPYIAIFRPTRSVMIGSRISSPIALIILVLSPDKDRSAHVQWVSRVARFLKQPNIITTLLSAKSADEVTALFIVNQDQSRAA